jgi:NTE family protein
MREFAAGTDKAHTPDEIWVIRINPQKRDREPVTLGTIEGRRNELAGNLSLNQELRFIQTVNEWVALFEPLTKAKQKHPAIAAFAEYKPIRLYLITMARDRADLGVGTKFDRSPDFVSGMRRHGEERGSAFLPLWLSDSPDLVEWPNGDALDAIEHE